MKIHLNHYRYYFFDMGSTLIEFHNSAWDEAAVIQSGYQRLIHELTAQYGAAVAAIADSAVIQPWYTYLEHERKKQRVEYPIAEELFFCLARQGITVSMQNILALLRTEYHDFYTYAHCTEGALEVLKALKSSGCSIAVVSNTMYPDCLYKEIFKRTGLAAYIDYYQFSYTNRFMKPHRSMFIKPLMALQAPISETIMVGDLEYSDITGAKQIGLAACLYDRSHAMQPTSADYTIHRLEALCSSYASH